MTSGQQQEALGVLTDLFAQGFRRLRHGDCIGADEQFARLAKKVGFYLIAHPGHPTDPTETKYRAFVEVNDVTLEPEPFLVRDKKMVENAALLLAAPFQDYEVQRSGTWTTVRYARDVWEIPIRYLYSGRNRQKDIYAGTDPGSTV